MTSFTLASVPEIAVGAGRIERLGEDVARIAGGRSRVVLVADPALASFGVTQRAADHLAAAGHAVSRFEAITSDAREQQVKAGARFARGCGARAVVGLGGGSALDVAKMIAAIGAKISELQTCRLAARPLPARRLALICAPTTAGTGSEVTSTVVLTGEDGTKFWYWGEMLKPDLAVLDPELTTSLPGNLTATTGLDALVHAIEAATNRNASNANDLYALAAIRRVIAFLPRAVREPNDLEARGEMLLAACFAGIAIENAGTGLAHNLAHAIGSLAPVHHGHAAALAMAATLDWVIEGNISGFGRVATAFGVEEGPQGLPDRYRDLLDEIGFDAALPANLDADALATRMAAPENAAMRHATSRTVDDAALPMLARRVLAFARREKAA